MKSSLCRRMALRNLKINSRFFLPRILAESGLLCCFYIILTLAMDKRLANVKGGNFLPTFMGMGAVIIGLLSGILLFYTNSFLMKQRKRELGLYNVLGMEKKHVLRVLGHESLICFAAASLTGLLLGVLFYKLSALAICRLLHTQVVVGFYFITPRTLLPSFFFFLLLDAFIYGVNYIQIRRMKPVELLSSRHTGEKEPKASGLLVVLGVLALGGGYWISLTVQSPLDALFLFFAAVILVILGTYFLFTAGSIFVLKRLRRNERYYYRPRHITAVSGLIYRMKQNAVGLASVAILATGVLVMTSSTLCLYSRTEQVLHTNYPHDYYHNCYCTDENGAVQALPIDVVEKSVLDAANQYGLDIAEKTAQNYLQVAYSYQNGVLISDRPTANDEVDYASLCMLTFITEDTYTLLTGQTLSLGENEAALCPLSTGDQFDGDGFTLHGQSYHITERLALFPVQDGNMTVVNHYGVVVRDEAALQRIDEGQQAAYGEFASQRESRLCVRFADEEKAAEKGPDFTAQVLDHLREYLDGQGHENWSIGGYDTIWEARGNLYGMYGTLLFLGILLGLTCLFATVLIIYYKQISEGYEDQERFCIMQKIGMSQKEIRQTIRTQIMLVFFLPLMAAGVHICFAYPILTKLLSILLLSDPWLFAKWCLAVYVVFAMVYGLIYSLTARTYYRIVS